MNLSMFLYITTLDKPFAAHLTLVRLLPGMNARMPLKTHTQPKRLGTILALKVPLAGMDHPVVVEKFFAAKCARAKLALEGSIIAVKLDVALQILLKHKSFVANLAEKVAHTSMALAMSVQDGVMAVAFGAQITGKRLFAGVDAIVAFEPFHTGERFGALIALKLGGVDNTPVLSKRRLGVTNHRALAAPVACWREAGVNF